MKIKINTNIIKRLDPCKDRLYNWLLHYKDFSGDLVEFLDLPNISYRDKIWVAVRVLPRFLLEVFAIDCAFNASYAASDAASDAAANAANAVDATNTAAAAAAAAYATVAAYASSAAVYVAAHDIKDGTTASDKEHKRQVETLIYLIQGAKE